MPSTGSRYRPGIFKGFLPCLTSIEAQRLSSHGATRSNLIAWRDGFICRVFLATGIRRAELTALRSNSILFHEGNPWLLINGKGGRVRTVPIPVTLLEESDSLRRAYRAPRRVLVPTRHHGRVTAIKYYGVWRAVARASAGSIGRHIHPHILRHTAATLMLNNGGSIIAVMAILGHTSIRTTERYLHAIPNAMSECLGSKYLEAVGLLPGGGATDPPDPFEPGTPHKPPPRLFEVHRGA